MKSNDTPTKKWPDLLERVRQESVPQIDLLPGILAALPARRESPITTFSQIEAATHRPAAWAAVTAALACASAIAAIGYSSLDDITLLLTITF